MVRDLFRDPTQTEFVIATIPTVLGVNESARLAISLEESGVPCRRIVVNQVPLCSLLRPQIENETESPSDPNYHPFLLDLDVASLGSCYQLSLIRNVNGF